MWSPDHKAKPVSAAALVKTVAPPINHHNNVGTSIGVAGGSRKTAPYDVTPSSDLQSGQRDVLQATERALTGKEVQETHEEMAAMICPRSGTSHNANLQDTPSLLLFPKSCQKSNKKMERILYTPDYPNLCVLM
jgi:hypothetical protein